MDDSTVDRWEFTDGSRPVRITNRLRDRLYTFDNGYYKIYSPADSKYVVDFGEYTSTGISIRFTIRSSVREIAVLESSVDRQHWR